jgi:hypothetical protein
MTEDQRKLCGELTIFPMGGRRISKEDFLRKFPSALEHGKLALKWLEEANNLQSAEDVDCALGIGFAFGFASEHKRILFQLLKVDWHYRHEDIVSALETWPTPDTIEPLYNITQWIPKSLEYDDARALAVKAIWALGKIPDAEAEKKLQALTHSENQIIRKNAQEQLNRRQGVTR